MTAISVIQSRSLPAAALRGPLARLLVAMAAILALAGGAHAVPCGDGVVDVGEQCDEAAANGDPGSCCTAACELRAAGETCRVPVGACDAAEICDGLAGACPSDAGIPDSDGDGLCDVTDNCPATANPGQEDVDGDGPGDLCDACPLDPADDGDGDGTCGDIDNCPATANPTQADLDGDGDGDVCDDADAVGLSLRRLVVVQARGTGRDKWSGQAEVNMSASPSFVPDADAGGIALSLFDDAGNLVDAESWAPAECAPTGAGLGSLRCKNSSGSQARFAKRSAAGFFRLTISVRNQSLPLATDTPLHVRLTIPGSIDRNDAIAGCAQKTNRTVCKEAP